MHGLISTVSRAAFVRFVLLVLSLGSASVASAAPFSNPIVDLLRQEAEALLSAEARNILLPNGVSTPIVIDANYVQGALGQLSNNPNVTADQNAQNVARAIPDGFTVLVAFKNCWIVPFELDKQSGNRPTIFIQRGTPAPRLSDRCQEMKAQRVNATLTAVGLPTCMLFHMPTAVTSRGYTYKYYRRYGNSFGLIGSTNNAFLEHHNYGGSSYALYTQTCLGNVCGEIGNSGARILHNPGSLGGGGFVH